VAVLRVDFAPLRERVAVVDPEDLDEALLRETDAEPDEFVFDRSPAAASEEANVDVTSNTPASTRKPVTTILERFEVLIGLAP
jgi:hypothetical protein